MTLQVDVRTDVGVGVGVYNNIPAFSSKSAGIKTCIRIEITVLKVVIWKGKSSVFWSQIVFYRSVNALP